MKPHVLLVYNTLSGTWKTGRRLKNILKQVTGEGFSLESQALGQVPYLKNIQAFDAVIVAGGDGSINSVVEYLINAEIENPPPLAVLPWGTSNDISRQINYRGTPGDILSSIKKGHVAWLDIGQVNHRYFVNVVAAGMFTDVAYLTGGIIKRTLGKPAYYIHGLSTLWSYPSFELKFVSHGSTFKEEVLLVLVLNGCRAGGLFQLAPEATLHDGNLHLVALKKNTGIFQLGKALHRVLQGLSLEHPGVIRLSSGNFDLHYPATMLPVIDGERGPPPPLQIKVIPARLPFIKVPAPETRTPQKPWKTG